MKELVNQAKAYIKEKGMTQVQFANSVGVGESTMSRWLKEEYPNMESVGEKVREYLDKEAVREQSMEAGSLGFVMTNVSKNAWRVLEYSRIQRTLGVIYGDAGIGKTKTAEEWAKDKSDVVMVTVTPATSAQKAFLKMLARKLKVDRNGTVDDVYMNIQDKLENRDFTLIIDEAQHLTTKTLEAIRSLNDSTKTAIVLIGNEVIYSKMLGKQQAEFAQLFSRIGMRSSLSVDMITEEDVRKIFSDAGNREVDYLHSICNSKFGLRGAVHVWVNASNNSNTTLDGLKAMAKQMCVNV